MWKSYFGVCCLLVAASGSSLFGQNAVLPSPVLEYSTEVHELESVHAKLKSDISKLATEWTDTTQRIQQNMGTMRNLVNEKTYAVMLRMQAGVTGFAANQSINQQLRNAAQEEVTGQGLNRYILNSQTQRLANILVQADALEHELKTIGLSKNLAAQRHLAMIQELKKIDAEVKMVRMKHQELIDRYWEWADVEGVRSDLELSAGLDQLRQSPEDNIGARLAKAITLVRLGKHDEAAPVIETLMQVGETAAVAIALRAELNAQTGQKRKYLIDLRKAFQMVNDDPRVRMHLGQASLAADDPKQAEREWEAVLKSAKHDIAAYRALTFILASSARPRAATLRNAKDYANLALRLAGEDWACEIALSLAEDANGNRAEALAAATRAKEMAIGNNLVYCEQLIEKLQRGDKVSWRF